MPDPDPPEKPWSLIKKLLSTGFSIDTLMPVFRRMPGIAPMEGDQKDSRGYKMGTYSRSETSQGVPGGDIKIRTDPGESELLKRYMGDPVKMSGLEGTFTHELAHHADIGETEGFEDITKLLEGKYRDQVGAFGHRFSEETKDLKGGDVVPTNWTTQRMRSASANPREHFAYTMGEAVRLLRTEHFLNEKLGDQTPEVMEEYLVHAEKRHPGVREAYAFIKQQMATYQGPYEHESGQE